MPAEWVGCVGCVCLCCSLRPLCGRVLGARCFVVVGCVVCVVGCVGETRGVWGVWWFGRCGGVWLGVSCGVSCGSAGRGCVCGCVWVCLVVWLGVCVWTRPNPRARPAGSVCVCVWVRDTPRELGPRGVWCVWCVLAAIRARPSVRIVSIGS